MIEFLIAVVPLLLLVGSLLCRVFPGHRTAMRLGARFFAPATTKPAVTGQPRPIPPRSHRVRGGLLIAFGLAQRPPPLAL